MARQNLLPETAVAALLILQERDPEAYTTLVRAAAGQAGGKARAQAAGVTKKEGAMSTEKSDVAKLSFDPQEYMGLPKDHVSVRYMDRSQATGEFCGGCVFFKGDRTMDMGHCAVIAGPVAQAGTCELFQAPVPEVRATTGEELNPDGTVQGDAAEAAKAAALADGAEEAEPFGRVLKVDAEQQLITGIVLEPDEVDTQDDTISVPEIQASAHDFMVEGRRIFLQHATRSRAVDIVESYIAPQDLQFGPEPEQMAKAGSWIMVTKVNDDQLWQAVKDGKFTGYSVRGVAYRAPSES